MKLTGSGGQRENITDMGVGEVVPGADVPEKKSHSGGSRVTLVGLRSVVGFLFLVEEQNDKEYQKDSEGRP